MVWTPPAHRHRCAIAWSSPRAPQDQGASVMQITTVGVDLAKHVFQIHGIDDEGQVVLRRRLRRAEVIPFFAGLTPCLVGMEACATSHHWARYPKSVLPLNGILEPSNHALQGPEGV